MNTDLALVLLLLVAAVAMFVIDKPRMDAVALLMLVVLPFTGAITVDEALAGFSDPNIVLIAALFVIGEALVRTGVAQGLGDAIVARAGGSETRMLVLLMLAVAGLGAFMSSTGVVAIFVPVTLRLAERTGIAPGRLMMPLSAAGLMSGMLTLVATAPNLVVNAELARHGAAEFRFFSFTPFGLPILVLGIAYMLLARRWLPVRDGEGGGAGRPGFAQWVESYQLSARERRLRVTGPSPLVGRTLGELRLRDALGANILSVERTRRSWRDLILPGATTELRAGDVLLVSLDTREADADAFASRFALDDLPLHEADFSDRAKDIGMAEAMVAPDSVLADRTLAEARFGTRTGLTVIGLRQKAVAAQQDLPEVTLRVGDRLLVIGPWDAIDALRADRRNVIVLHPAPEPEAGRFIRGKTPQALSCLALMVVLMVSGIVSNVQAALIACLLLGAFRCIDLDGAYRSIHWKSLVLIVGMLPFSLALQRTGGVDLAVGVLAGVAGGAHPVLVLASLFLITAVLGLFISNTATAVLMAPVGIAMASQLEASPQPFAMIVALAASAAFMTPISSPVNTLVVSPGRYTFGDFVRIGVPFTLVVMVVSVALVHWLMPLR
jgi:di/tricarboxylate transporter